MVRFIGGSALALAILLSINLSADSLIQLELTPHIQPSPGTLTLKVTIPKHKLNREYCFGYQESGLVMYVSCRPLRGTFSATTHWLSPKNLPPGKYLGFVYLFRSSQEYDPVGFASHPFEVVGFR